MQGFYWALSYLGATVPAHEIEQVIEQGKAGQVVLHPERLGLGEKGQQAFVIICDSILQSRSYRALGEIPMGAFIAIFIGSASHYYAVTEAPRTLEEFIRLHDTPLRTYEIRRSQITGESRMIAMNKQKGIKSFWAITRSSDSKTNASEAIDMMANGQLRFMVYDESGQLVSAPREPMNQAGKPAKCMWCHEGRLQKEHEARRPNRWLRKFVNRKNSELDKFRHTLSTHYYFEPHPAHTYMEKMYINYMEPTLLQLSKEWQMSVSELEIILRATKRHLHVEFSFGDSLFHRKDLTPLAPYSYRIPRDVREHDSRDRSYLLH